jgi:hypothetical protein
MSDKPESDSNPWSNGVTIKKTRDGYSWTVGVAAENNSVDALRAAASKARQIEAELQAAYPAAVGARGSLAGRRR